MKAISLFLFILFASTMSSEENNSILIYGDSISAGYGMEKESQWSESLKTLLSDKGFKILVYNDANYRSKRSFFSLLSEKLSV